MKFAEQYNQLIDTKKKALEQTFVKIRQQTDKVQNDLISGYSRKIDALRDRKGVTKDSIVKFRMDLRDGVDLAIKDLRHAVEKAVSNFRN